VRRWGKIEMIKGKAESGTMKRENGRRRVPSYASRIGERLTAERADGGRRKEAVSL
jgi:hypothetical protein